MLKNLKTYEYITSKILAVDYIESEIAYSLSKKILELEKIVATKKNDFLDDGDIPFDLVSKKNITTKYHNYYSLLDFNYEETDIIIEKLKKIIFELTGQKEFYLKIWANVYRCGDYIGYHSHLNDEIFDIKNEKVVNNYLSGHCFLYGSEKTYTTYYFSSNKKNLLGGIVGTDVENIPGEISIFSSCLGHEFKKWYGDLRIGLAFDIMLDTTIPIDEYKTTKQLHLIK